MHTFFQLTRAWEYNKAMFDTGDDEYRMLVFEAHETYFMWYKDEIKEWLGEAWHRLNTEKPAWFTEGVLRTVPIELIPHYQLESVREEMDEEVYESLRVSRKSGRSLRKVFRMTLVGSLGGPKAHLKTSPRKTAHDIAADVASEFKDEVVELWEQESRRVHPNQSE